MVLILAAAVVLLQAQAPQPKAENPADMAAQTSWVGCVQAGSAPATFRLNLDDGTAVAGPGDPVSLGEPFIQLLAAPKLNLGKHVGDHVTIKGKVLTPEEAEHQAALHPDQQEANATAGGTGGRSGVTCATCGCGRSRCRRGTVADEPVTTAVGHAVT